ncbi:MAG: hypothetical protein MJZ50_06575 [Treponema sp.]|nr:hypothetical protein [Treponema sp.]
MIQFSYTTIKPTDLFTVTFINEKKENIIQNTKEIKNEKSTCNNLTKPKALKKRSNNKKRYSISISNDYSYVPFVPAYDFYNHKIREDGSYGTHLYRDCFGRFYDNCCYDNMD